MQHTSTIEQIPTTGICAAIRRGHRERTGHQIAGHLVIDSQGWRASCALAAPDPTSPDSQRCESRPKGRHHAYPTHRHRPGVRHRRVHGSAVTFVTSIYGGPVVMVTGAMQVFVDRAVTARCGDLVADPHLGRPVLARRGHRVMRLTARGRASRSASSSPSVS